MKSISLVAILALFSVMTTAQHIPLIVGSYTANDSSTGVYIYDFDTEKGTTILRTDLIMQNPSFIARKNNMLYAVNENTKGGLSAIQFENNELKLRNQLPTNGAHPCHVVVHPSEPLAIVSNYSGGSLIMYSLDKEGKLAKEEDFIQFEGSGADRARQASAHVHSAFFNVRGDRLYVSDLGTDRIMEYGIQKKANHYAFEQLRVIKTKPGSGPRHVAIAADGKVLYVVAELTGEVFVYKDYKGEWKLEQTLPIYKEGYTGKHGAADIKISPDGKYVYATNRGDANVIGHYKIQKNGLLALVNTYSVLGDSPRNFNFSPDGKFLLVSNQQTNEIVIFGRDTKTGILTDSKNRIAVGKPVCVIF